MKAPSTPVASNTRSSKPIKPTTKGLAPGASSTQQVTTKPNIFSAPRKPPHWTDALIPSGSIVQKIIDAKLKEKSI